MASLFGLEKQEVVRIKVKKCDGMKQPEYKKLCVDPQLTSFDILRNLLARAFNIHGEFTMSYLARDDYGQEMYLSLLSDWDMDAAFLSASDPCLRLKVDLKPFEEGLDDWDVVAPLDIQPKSSLTMGMNTGFLNSLTGHISSQVGKTVSQVSKAIGLKSEEEGIFKPIKPPMTDAEFHHFLDAVGHVIRPEEFRMAVYQGGVEPSLRSVVWRHLLNVFPEGMSGRERFEYTKKKNNEYYKLRDQWRELFSSNKEIEELKFVTNMVKKDVLRTDRTHKLFEGADDNQNVISLFNILVTYAITHPDVSYCQGMSDLASPILVVQKDEAATYLCFCGLMKRLRVNFLLDGVAMTNKFQQLALLLQHQDPDFFAYLKSQDAHDMFFCYRWLLLELKREFPFDDALLMLEVMWSSLPPDPPETELMLTDPSFSFARLLYSPVSPSVTNNAYMRLKSLCRQMSHTKIQSGDNAKITPEKSKTPMAITPLEEEKDLDPKDYLPVEDKMPQDLIDKSSQIDEALSKVGDTSSQSFSQGEDNETEVVTSQRKCDADSSEEIAKCDNNIECSGNVQGSANGSESVVHHSAENYKTKRGSYTDQNDVTSEGYDSLQNAEEGLSSYRCASASVPVNEELMQNGCSNEDPNSPSKKRPQSIELSTTFEAIAKNKTQSVLIRNETGITERSSKLGVPKEAEINSCEEAVENPNIDFVHVHEKLAKLPPPAEFGYGNPFLMFLCMTLLTQQRDHIMRNRMDYNDLAMHFDKMVRRHNVFRVLRQAQSQYALYLRNQANAASNSSGSSEDVSV